jgi:hypothetical protein
MTHTRDQEGALRGLPVFGVTHRGPHAGPETGSGGEAVELPMSSAALKYLVDLGKRCQLHKRAI